MARIRSVHAGLFTDEEFMSRSPHARLLWIGLWTEADDQGVFEWKPLTIKARLLPADNVDISDLLAELAAADFIKIYEMGGRQYGAVRNFRRFQRPKYPNAVHPIPDDLRKYVGLDASAAVNGADKGRVVPKHSPNAGGKPPQMEDGEGDVVGEERVEAPAKGTRFSIDVLPDDWRAFCEQERPDLKPQSVFLVFSDYWRAKPGKDGRKADWQATWRNWVRKEKAPNGKTPPAERDFSNY